MDPLLRIDIKVMSTPSLVSVIRRIVYAALKEVGTSEECIDQAVLITGEACGNIVRHAYDKPSPYKVSLEINTDALVLEFTDWGKGFDTSTPPEDGHFGLSLISSIDPDVQIESVLGEYTLVRVWLSRNDEFTSA